LAGERAKFYAPKGNCPHIYGETPGKEPQKKEGKRTRLKGKRGLKEARRKAFLAEVQDAFGAG